VSLRQHHFGEQTAPEGTAMMKSKVDTQKVLKQLREKVDREIQGAEADIESIRKGAYYT
jgi:hypothetical protein